MFRSEEMLFYQLIMPRESAWAIMDQLGYLGKVEIVDHDPSIPIIARPFVNYIRRCDDLLHKLDQITDIAIKLDMMKNNSQQSIKNIEPRNHTHQYLDTLEDVINNKVNSFSEHNRHRDQLKDSYGFCCKFLPQILFLTSTIGYMDFLIMSSLIVDNFSYSELAQLIDENL